MAVNFSQATNNARSQAIITLAGTNPVFKIYTGTAPVNADAAAGGTLLATIPISGALGTTSGGILTFTVSSTVYASATGTASYCRLLTAAGATVADYTNLTTDIVLTTTSMQIGGTVQIVSGSVQTEPYP